MPGVRACRRAPPAVCMPKRPRIRSAWAGQRAAPRHHQGEGPTAKSGRDSALARAHSTVKCCQNPGQIKSETRSDKIRTGGQMNRNPQTGPIRPTHQTGSTEEGHLAPTPAEGLAAHSQPVRSCSSVTPCGPSSRRDRTRTVPSGLEWSGDCVRMIPNRFPAPNSEIDRKRLSAAKSMRNNDLAALSMVAGVGFEPTTFRL